MQFYAQHKSEIDKQNFCKKVQIRHRNLDVSASAPQYLLSLPFNCTDINGHYEMSGNLARFRIIANNLGENWLVRDKRRADGKKGLDEGQ